MKEKQCPKCGGGGKIKDIGYDPKIYDCGVCNGTGKAPESTEARPNILELPEDRQVELYTRAAEASNEMQREVLERAQQPEATELDEYANLTPREAADKFDKEQESKRVNEAMTAVVREAAKKFVASQPQQNAGELDEWWHEANGTGSERCSDCERWGICAWHQARLEDLRRLIDKAVAEARREGASKLHRDIVQFIQKQTPPSTAIDIAYVDSFFRAALTQPEEKD